jgi:hypothetical protein
MVTFPSVQDLKSHSNMCFDSLLKKQLKPTFNNQRNSQTKNTLSEYRILL